MRKRLAATLLAVPLALGSAAPADASITVLPGCWGAVFTFCDVAVTEPVTMGSWGTLVCAGTCSWVYTPWPGLAGSTCVTYGDAYGGRSQICA